MGDRVDIRFNMVDRVDIRFNLAKQEDPHILGEINSSTSYLEVNEDVILNQGLIEEIAVAAAMMGKKLTFVFAGINTLARFNIDYGLDRGVLLQPAGVDAVNVLNAQWVSNGDLVKIEQLTKPYGLILFFE